MPPIAFLALLTIVLLMLGVLRLELNFRRTGKSPPDPARDRPRPELRIGPAGGYCQAPLRAPQGAQARRAGFAL